MQNFKPVGTNVLIKCDALPRETSAGIFIPDMAADKAKPTRGTVIKIGPAVKEVQPGNRIVFPSFGGVHATGLAAGSDKFWLLPERDLLAVIEGE